MNSYSSAKVNSNGGQRFSVCAVAGKSAGFFPPQPKCSKTAGNSDKEFPAMAHTLCCLPFLFLSGCVLFRLPFLIFQELLLIETGLCRDSFRKQKVLKSFFALDFQFRLI